MTPRATYARFAAFLHKLESKYTPRIQAIFAQQATAYNEYAKIYGFNTSKVNDFFIPSPLFPVINDLHYTAGGNYGNDVYKQLKGTKGATMWVQPKERSGVKVHIQLPSQNVLFNTTQQIGNKIVSVLRLNLAQNVNGMSDTVKEDVLAIIKQGNEQGWGYDKTAGKIADSVGSKWRALRIVRTESVKASNMGAIEGARLTGFEMQKRWVSAHDNRVRGNPSGKYPESQYDHWDIDSVTVPLDQPFLLGARATGTASDNLQFPGDPSGAPGDIINCRCTLSFIVKRDERGRPMRVQRSVIAA